MRSFLRFVCVRGSWPIVVAAAACGAEAVHAGDIARLGMSGNLSVVGGLAVTKELEPLAEIAALQRDPLVSMRPTAVPAEPADTQLRTSVPDANRSRSLAGGTEVFATSKVVLPLLVADMEPAVSPVSRLMSGSPVGVRPTLPLFNRIPLTRASAR